MSSSEPATERPGLIEQNDQSRPANITQLSNFQLVRHKAILTSEVLEHKWEGNGTESDPYLVEWLADDPRNPKNFRQPKKWTYTIMAAVSCLAVAFSSSAYTGGVSDIMREFHVGRVVAFLGVSAYVAGFAIGPLFWAPLSELHGRQNLFIATYGLLVVFNAAAAGAQSIVQLIVFRLLAGSFGSSPLTNAGGVIADMFASKDRGLATTIFACGPFLGPILGPIVGGFVGDAAGWRWVMGLMTLLTAALYIPCCLVIPETYGPVLLRLRARMLQKANGKVYLSRIDFERGPKTVAQMFKVAISRPLVLLVSEPIVLIISTYMAIIYGTMYLLFAAFPIIFKTSRGWSTGKTGLAFLGIAVGMFTGLGWMIYENTRYVKKSSKYPNNRAPPEMRLPPCMVGAVLIPIGLFWFAWTNGKELHWIISIIGSVPFGFGMVLIYLPCMNYLVDTYVVYAASCLAGSTVLRSILGAVFPLFAPRMYDQLGLHWASSVPAFLALFMAPAPFIFYHYGPQIRRRGKYAADAAKVLAGLEKVSGAKREVPWNRLATMEVQR